MSITREETILCRNCRSRCSADNNFCPRCGERLRGTTSITGVMALPRLETASAVRHSYRPSLALLLVCALLFACGLLTLLLGLTRPTSTTSSPGPHVPPAEGIIRYYNAHAQNDAIACRLHGLSTLPKGETYILWLINPHRPDQLLPVGPLSPDKSGAISYASDRRPGFNPDRLDLRLLFPKIELTIEHVAARYLRPKGTIALQGELAPGALDSVTLRAP